jgi:hypothetical protein
MRKEMVLVAALCLSSRLAQAGGPIHVSPDGQPFTWDTQRPIYYTLELGSFGAIPNATASRWVVESFRRWAAVEGTELRIAPTLHPEQDIRGDNVLEILNSSPWTRNLVIFDADGSVLDTLYGKGTSETTSGRSGPTRYDWKGSRIFQAIAILNGKRSGSFTAEWWQHTFLRETGHFLGLDHSQINAHVAVDGDATNDDRAPCMSLYRGPNARPTLHADDRAWIRALYPKRGAAVATGAIRGCVFLPDGKTGLQGVQVVARRDGDEEVTAVSGISGYRYKEGVFGSRDVVLRGTYEIPGLPPGSYRLAIEPLAGSPRMNVRRAEGLPTRPAFWRDGGSQASLPAEATLVPVSAGATEARDFILEGPSLPPQEVAEVKPNHLPELARTLALPAVVTGRVGPNDPHYQANPAPGALFMDAVEAWHRIVITEPTTLSITLTAADPAADLTLSLASDSALAGTLTIAEQSANPGTPPESLQRRVLPGIHFIGVSYRDDVRGEPTEYRLTVLPVPSPDPPTTAPNPPRITLAVVSDLAPGQLRVWWQTDQDANALLWVGDPLREQGSPALAREHGFVVTGLSPETGYRLSLTSRNASGEAVSLPNLSVATPRSSIGGKATLSAGVWSIAPQDEEGEEYLIGLRVTNTGDGQAQETRIERLDLPHGWRFAAAPALPLDLGTIGSGGSAVVLLRLIRDAGARPPDLLLEGSYRLLDGSARRIVGTP